MYYIKKITSLIIILAVLFSVQNANAVNTYTTSLNGTTQYWSVADSASLSITGNLTMEAWVKFTSAPVSGEFHAIVGKWGYNTNNRSYVMYYTNSAGTLKIQVQLSQNGINESVKTWNVDLGTGWKHIALVYTASTYTGELFVDSVSQGTVDFGATYTSIYDSTAALIIGREEDGATHYFDGQIDDVRVWNGARTSTQISSNYNCSLIGTESGLAAYWKFDNDGLDETANNNDLTNNNSATFQSASLPFTNTCGTSTAAGEEFIILFE